MRVKFPLIWDKSLLTAKMPTSIFVYLSNHLQWRQTVVTEVIKVRVDLKMRIWYLILNKNLSNWITKISTALQHTSWTYYNKRPMGLTREVSSVSKRSTISYFVTMTINPSKTKNINTKRIYEGAISSKSRKVYLNSLQLTF